VWSGSLARDVTLRIFPSGIIARVRLLHTHGKVVDGVRAGDRAAIALAGVELDQVGRGAVLVQGDAWRTSRVLRGDVALLHNSVATLGPRSRVRFHLGTSEVGARLVVPDGTLAPGVKHSARIVLDEAIIARAGDRFVLRAASPVSTLGGGIITDPLAPIRARPWPLTSRDAETTLATLAAEAGPGGVDVRTLPVRLGILPGDVEPLLQAAGGWRVGTRFISAAARGRLAASATEVLDGYHAQHPLEPGAPLQWLRSRLDAPDDVATALLEALTSAGDIVLHQGLAARSNFSPALSPSQRSLANALTDAIATAGAEPPSIDELAERLGAAPSELLTLARWQAREGTLVPVEPARYYSRSAVDLLKAKMQAGMSEEREYAPAELRDLLGLTRKFLIPFLEYCDREGYTIRAGLGRRLAAPKS
jgi:selenocysteine-specific elongation factor